MNSISRVSKRKSLSGSISVASCPSPSPIMKEHLASLEEKEEKEEKDPETIVNPTPMVCRSIYIGRFLDNSSHSQMQDMINKRKSLGPKTPMKSRADTILAKSKEKSKEKQKPQATTPPCPPSPGPRQDFPGKNGAKAFLVAGQPLDLRLAKVRTFFVCLFNTLHLSPTGDQKSSPLQWLPWSPSCSCSHPR